MEVERGNEERQSETDVVWVAKLLCREGCGEIADIDGEVRSKDTDGSESVREVEVDGRDSGRAGMY